MTKDELFTLIFGLLLGFALGMLSASFFTTNEHEFARECFNGTLTTVEQEYIVYTDSGRFYCYTSEWLGENR